MLWYFMQLVTLEDNLHEMSEPSFWQKYELYNHHENIPICRIGPNYRTVRLGFSKLQGTLGCGKIRIYLLRIHY